MANSGNRKFMIDVKKSKRDEAEIISKKLLAWYGKHKRDLPWRRTKNPYRIWISEIMLQQTQVDTVIPYYHRFLKRFPDVRALAGAGLEDVLKLWENLGYYSRARNLHAAAQMILEKHGGVFPEDPKSVAALPGIGAYTTGAILSIAFGMRLPAIDGNVKRVAARLYAIEEPTAEKTVARKIADRVRELVPANDPGDFNQALMDLGAGICIPEGPHCGACPLKALCRAFQMGAQGRIPAVQKKGRIPLRQSTAAFIPDKKNRILITQRPAQGLLGGLWKLPGGFQAGDETLIDALKRTVWEETGLRVNAAEPAAIVRHTFTHFRMILSGFRCTAVSGRLHPPEGIHIAWIDPSELSHFAFGKADRELLLKIIDQTGNKRVHNSTD